MSRCLAFSALRLLILSGTVLLLALPVSAQGQPNLPQPRFTVTLPESTRRTLEAALTRLPGPPPWTLPPADESLLLDLLPEDFRSACPGLIQYWGEVAQGTAQWSVRALHRLRQPDQLSVLLAFRCGSTYPDYAGYFDERPALFTLEPGSAQLRLIPLAEECDNCSDLYQLKFSQSLVLAEGPLAELVVRSSSDNPCCDGPSAWNREQLLYLLLPWGEPVLLLERAHESYEHDDVEGDSEEICYADVGYSSDAAGRLAAITTTSHCRADHQPQPTETRRYRWNPAQRRFEEVPPAQP